MYECVIRSCSIILNYLLHGFFDFFVNCLLSTFFEVNLVALIDKTCKFLHKIYRILVNLIFDSLLFLWIVFRTAVLLIYWFSKLQMSLVAVSGSFIFIFIFFIIKVYIIELFFVKHYIFFSQIDLIKVFLILLRGICLFSWLYFAIVM